MPLSRLWTIKCSTNPLCLKGVSIKVLKGRIVWIIVKKTGSISCLSATMPSIAHLTPPSPSPFSTTPSSHPASRESDPNKGKRLIATSRWALAPICLCSRDTESVDSPSFSLTKVSRCLSSACWMRAPSPWLVRLRTIYSSPPRKFRLQVRLRSKTTLIYNPSRNFTLTRVSSPTSLSIRYKLQPNLMKVKSIKETATLIPVHSRQIIQLRAKTKSTAF
jgi:hypothetical protein